MNAADINLKLIDSYYGLLKNLSNEAKLELVTRLSNSIINPNNHNDDSLKALFGSLITEESAEEIIAKIKTSRTFKRNRIEF